MAKRNSRAKGSSYDMLSMVGNGDVFAFFESDDYRTALNSVYTLNKIELLRLMEKLNTFSAALIQQLELLSDE